MAWNTLRTNYGAEVFPSADLNDITENINTLKDPPSAHYELNEGADYTTTSTTFVDIDATNLALAITTNGSDILAHFHGSLGASALLRAFFNIDVDGSPAAADDGIIAVYLTNAAGNSDGFVSFTRLITGLSAGSHTFKLQWKTSTGTLTLYAGAGSTDADNHAQFWVREVS